MTTNFHMNVFGGNFKLTQYPDIKDQILILRESAEMNTPEITVFASWEQMMDLYTQLVERLGTLKALASGEPLPPPMTFASSTDTLDASKLVTAGLEADLSANQWYAPK